MTNGELNDREKTAVIWGSILGFLATTILGIVALGIHGDAWRRESVERGYAEWVVDQKTGHATWRWRK